MDGLFEDLRYGLRVLLKHPGFTIVAVLALALGIGANTAMFTVINAVLLRPLPYREPGQLVQVQKQSRPGGAPVIGAGNMVSDREFFAWKQQSRSFAQLAAFAGGAVNLSGVEQAERLMCVAKRVNRRPPDATSQFPAETVADSLGRMHIVSGDSPRLITARSNATCSPARRLLSAPN